MYIGAVINVKFYRPLNFILLVIFVLALIYTFKASPLLLLTCLIPIPFRLIHYQTTQMARNEDDNWFTLSDDTQGAA